MPGRHHTETPAGGSARSPAGTLVLVTVAVLAVLAGLATIAVRLASAYDAPDIVVQPSASMPGPPGALDGSPLENVFPSPPPTASATPPGSPAGSAVTMGSPPGASTAVPSPAVRAGNAAAALASPTVAAPTAASTRTPPDALTASYAAAGTSADGFEASITVRNPTGAPHAWTVMLTYPSRITVTGYWNTTPTATGRRLSFDGGPLAAGTSYTFGFQAVAGTSRSVNPTACSINGNPCAGF